MRFSVFLAGILVFGGVFVTASADDEIKLDPQILEVEQQRIAAIDRARPSAVCVFVPGGGGGGSGVLISPEGYALTNFHVTSPAGTFMRCGLSDGNIYDAVLVGLDPVGDLAMIRLLGRDDFPVAKIADSRLARAGDWCMVIGNPFLLASNLQPTVTWGILSGVGRYQYPSGTLLEYADCIQTDASINPGNSGGPIYNAKGELLGIVGRASFEKRGRVNVGVGYAISIHQAKNFLGYLRSGRIVDHATLGATVATDEDGGVRVTNILESCDAYRRGLRYGSEILEIDGRPVQTANDVQNVMGTLPNGWRVKIAFRENGETVETIVRLMGVHRQDELIGKMASALPPPPPAPEPKNKEGDDKDDEKEKEKAKPGPAPRLPAGRAPKPKTPIPASVKKFLTAKKGFANYFFNNLQRERFIKSLRSQSPKHEGKKLQAWQIIGETVAKADGKPLPVKIRVDSGNMALLVGENAIQTKTKADLYDAVENRSIVGVLPALDAWRRMLRSGPDKFGDSYYLGSMPLGGERPLRDCMVGLDGELEVRWLYHPDNELVEAVEVFADRDSDPAEVWIEWNGDKIDTLDLRYGVDSLLKIKVNSWKITEAGSNTDDMKPLAPKKPANGAEDTDQPNDSDSSDADAEDKESDE